MTTKYIVNNISGQTINGELIKPYKVFTALLTQTGNTNPDSFNGGELIVGTSYQLQSPSIGADFTNVGAPNNNDGTWFIATGTTPNNWGTGTVYCDYGAPVVTVLENTIGNIWFSYNNVGEYYVKSNALFTPNKTLAFGSFYNPGPQIYFYINNSSIGENEVFLQTGDPISADGYLSNTPIEIRVYY